MTQSRHNTLVLACGALAKEVLALKASMNLADDVFDLQCLPANYHNYPDKIVPALKETLDGKGANYDHVLIGYGDCGTGGGLDRLLEDYPKAERLPGAHCYAFYAGLAEFETLPVLLAKRPQELPESQFGVEEVVHIHLPRIQELYQCLVH